jgi:hypothetical protein
MSRHRFDSDEADLAPDGPELAPLWPAAWSIAGAFGVSGLMWWGIIEAAGWLVEHIAH